MFDFLKSECPCCDGKGTIDKEEGIKIKCNECDYGKISQSKKKKYIKKVLLQQNAMTLPSVMPSRRDIGPPVLGPLVPLFDPVYDSPPVSPYHVDIC